MSNTQSSGHLDLRQVLADEYNKVLAEKNEEEIDPKKESLSTIYKHFYDKRPTALCLSGGGIRSATFGLGVIQGFAHYGLLDKFHYLSTVSGGGYIGSWLTAWIHREQKDSEQPGQGLAQVTAQLDPMQSSPRQLPAPAPRAHGKLTSDPEPVDPEPGPIRRLRQYSNYLTPRLGLLSADTWTWIAIYLRNLILNWLVLIPLMLAVLAIPKMSVPIVNISSLEHGAWLLWAGLGLTWLGVLFVSTIQPSSDGEFMRSHRDQKSFLIGCELPLLLGSVLLTTYWAWYRNTRAGDPLPELTIFVLLGIGLHFLSWVPYMFIQLPRLIKAIKQLGALVLAIVLAGAAGGLFLGLLTTLIPAFSNPGQAAKFYVCFATPALLSALLLAKTLFVGLFSRYSDDNDREWWARAGGWILIAIVGWSAISVLVMYGPDGLALLPATVTMLLGGSSGVATFMLGRSAQTPANLKQQTELTGKLKDRVNLKDVTLKLAAPLFAAFLIALLSFATNAVIASLTMQSVFEINWEPRVFVYIVSFSLAMLALGAVMASFINVNKFSLHAAYRNRLIRAYLGASNKTRDPNPFTGFDPEDNIAMHELGVKKPFHVVNMALNLVRGKNLAWQQRKAESFTVTPLHAGSYRVGYRRSQDYGKGDKGESISLGTAVAISGAAASPNMGYHSSPGITFLLTLFNARLGWWLGNPGAAGQRTYDRAYPKFAIGPLLAETFGLTDDQSRYIYLSDGGHFENLGLYEMVLRRCRFIVLSDAGQDAEYTFEDLGNAIRKIRIDLGIPIEMQEVQACIYSRSREKQGKCCAIGTIKYSCVDEGAEDGHLLYLKPTFYGNEPIDIYNYAQTNKAFPHEPTFDQWFSESQLESYRMLGFNTVRAVFEGSKPSDSQLPLTDLDALRRRALEYLSAS